MKQKLCMSDLVMGMVCVLEKRTVFQREMAKQIATSTPDGWNLLCCSEYLCSIKPINISPHK